ncbi:hypothetical protein BRC83_09195 [Halobacteriales archaeon QS_1_68_17]|nr:MAG: hypothetical protein BRC83_09195 [Halobacteriales archaeon QS_1_68_17]
MSDRREVTVSVDASTYREWRAVADEEYEGMEDLVRTAVENEIDGRRDQLTMSELLEALRNPYD